VAIRGVAMSAPICLGSATPPVELLVSSGRRRRNVSEKKNLPSHRIFVVRNYEKDGEEKASWTEIGVAFQNKLGFSIQLVATPLDGRCVALPYEEKPFEQNAENRGKPPQRAGRNAAS
jgi:hypothetical protein